MAPIYIHLYTNTPLSLSLYVSTPMDPWAIPIPFGDTFSIGP